MLILPGNAFAVPAHRLRIMSFVLIAMLVKPVIIR